MLANYYDYSQNLSYCHLMMMKTIWWEPRWSLLLQCPEDLDLFGATFYKFVSCRMNCSVQGSLVAFRICMRFWSFDFWIKLAQSLTTPKVNHENKIIITPPNLSFSALHHLLLHSSLHLLVEHFTSRHVLLWVVLFTSKISLRDLWRSLN